MKTAQIVSAKEIRNDLVGFLQKLKNGQRMTIIYRSKPFVTIAAEDSSVEPAEKPGSPEAIKRAVALARQINRTHKPVLDPNKSYKELRDELYADSDYLR